MPPSSEEPVPILGSAQPPLVFPSFLLSVGIRASQLAQWVKNVPAVQEKWVQSPGREGPLEEGMETHSSILVWRVPWTEEPGGLQSVVSQSLKRLSANALDQERLPPVSSASAGAPAAQKEVGYTFDL